MSTLAQRLDAVQQRIADAAEVAGRDPADVTLVAVSKTHAPEDVADAITAGATHFGENRVQELVAKAEVVDAPSSVQWHLIGPLQSNKAQHVVDRGWWLHGVDRTSLVDRLARVAQRPGDQRVLVQVNVGEDPAKHGCTVEEAPSLVDHAVRAGLAVRGLMTVPPLPPDGVDAATDARRHFQALRELRDRLAREHADVTELSMGMSADLEAAVAEGATMVRIGTAVFGARGTAPWQPAA